MNIRDVQQATLNQVEQVGHQQQQQSVLFTFFTLKTDSVAHLRPAQPMPRRETSSATAVATNYETQIPRCKYSKVI